MVKNVTMGICHSCGMKMHRQGTNADGTPNGDYCGRCFKDGEFTLPDATIEQMVRISAQSAMDNDPDLEPEVAIREMSELLPTLKRWRGQPGTG